MTITEVVKGFQSSSAGARTVTLATAPSSGDLIIVALGHSGAHSGLTMATPSSGWTTLASDQNGSSAQGVKILARISDGTEGTTYTTAALTGSGCYLSVIVLRSDIGWPAIGSILDTSAAAHTSSNTELTAPSSGALTISQASTVQVSCARGGASMSATLAYRDGSATGVTPTHRGSNGAVDYQINTAAPATPKTRYASWTATGASMVTAVLKETIAVSYWPAGTGDQLVTVTNDSDIPGAIQAVTALLRLMVTVFGAPWAGVAATKATNGLPLTGGTIDGPVTIAGPLTLNAAPTSPLHAATKAYADAAIPASEVASPAVGHALVYNSATSKWGNVLSPWTNTPKLPLSPLITDYQQLAPPMTIPTRNFPAIEGGPLSQIERPPLYDTNINSASTANVDGGGFNTPAGTVMYVDAVNGLDSNAGTLAAPKQTITAAVTAINAGTTNTTILLNSPSGQESHFREHIPNTVTKVLGIQAVKGARVVVKGSDIFPSAAQPGAWTYVAGKGWEWSGVYNPQIFKISGTNIPDADQLFVDSAPYIQATAPFPVAGEFYVDRARQALGLPCLYIGEPSTWVPGQHIIEVTVRGYVAGNGNGTSIAPGHNKANFFVRGMRFEHYGSDVINDVNAVLRLTGDNNLVEYCVFAFSSGQALSMSPASAATNVGEARMRQVVFVNNGLNAVQTYTRKNNRWSQFRIDRSNWEHGYDITPSATARWAGTKLAADVNGVYDWFVVRNCHSNGFWHDVNCSNMQVSHFLIEDNYCYGYTQEVGDGLLMVDGLIRRNGNTALGNRDNYRISGVSNCEIAHVTSIDALGGQFGIYEDWRTYDANPAGQVKAAGDTYNTRVYNNVYAATSRATRELSYSINGKVTGSQATQTLAFQGEQMYAVDPWASPLVCQSANNALLRLNTLKNHFRWSTPTTDFLGTGFAHTDLLTLAQAQLKGGSPKCEVGTVAVDDMTGTDAALLLKYFPGSGSGDWSWKTYTQIPGTILSTLGSTPSARVQAILAATLPGGGASSYTSGVAKRGCYHVPVLVQT